MQGFIARRGIIPRLPPWPTASGFLNVLKGLQWGETLTTAQSFPSLWELTSFLCVIRSPNVRSIHSHLGTAAPPLRLPLKQALLGVPGRPVSRLSGVGRESPVSLWWWPRIKFTVVKLWCLALCSLLGVCYHSLSFKTINKIGIIFIFALVISQLHCCICCSWKEIF